MTKYDELAAAIRGESETNLTHAQMLTWVRRKIRAHRAGPTRDQNLIAVLNRRLDEETREHIKTVARLEVAEATRAGVLTVMVRMDEARSSSPPPSMRSYSHAVIEMLRVALGVAR